MNQTAIIHRRSGFTLVEILVVIVIFAILTGITSMAFGKFRERAKSIVSANNMRQWGHALVIYTSDNNGDIPYEGDRDRVTLGNIANPVNELAWFNVLPPYVGEKAMKDFTAHDRNSHANGWGIHYCPLVEWRDSRRPAFSYMMNSQIYNPGGPSDSPEQAVKLLQILEPSATVMFADLNQSYNDRPRGRGRHVDDRQPGGKVNLVFFDGSMRAFDADYVLPDTHIDGGVTFTENNRPDLIWNPWIHPRTSAR